MPILYVAEEREGDGAYANLGTANVVFFLCEYIPSWTIWFWFGTGERCVIVTLKFCTTRRVKESSSGFE
jgi:hypothetical protein